MDSTRAPRRSRIPIFFAWSLRAALAVSLTGAATLPLPAAEGDPLGSAVAPFDQGGSHGDRVAAVAVQPDGRIVLAGTVETGPGATALALARFLPNGALDPAFGSGGRVVNPFGFGVNHSGVAVHLLADGRFLVAGTVAGAVPGDENFYAGRLLDNGAADPSFAMFGANIVFFNVGGDGTDLLGAMDVDAQGRILLAGSVDVSASDIDIGVARLLPDGAFDPAFSGDARAVVAISSQIELGLAVAAHPDGGVVVGGASWVTDLGGHFALALARLRPDGTPEGSFGSGGSLVMGWAHGGTNNALVWDLAVWPDGEIVTAGDVAIGPNAWRWQLLRFSPTGTFLNGVEGRFCAAGAPPCPPDIRDSLRAVRLQGDGQIVMAGFGMGVSGTTDFGIGRFRRDLSPDPAFGTSGRAMFDFAYGPGASTDDGTALAFDRDGRLVVAGSVEFNGPDTDFAWVRFDSAHLFADDFEWPGGLARWSAAAGAGSP